MTIKCRRAIFFLLVTAVVLVGMTATAMAAQQPIKTPGLPQSSLAGQGFSHGNMQRGVQQSLPATTGQQLPATTGQQLPATTGQQLPATTGQQSILNIGGTQGAGGPIGPGQHDWDYMKYNQQPTTPVTGAQGAGGPIGPGQHDWDYMKYNQQPTTTQ